MLQYSVHIGKELAKESLFVVVIYRPASYYEHFPGCLEQSKEHCSRF